MLKQITFTNWKSFKEATLYIDSFTALIGTNASGKSNVLDGLEFLRRVSTEFDVESAFGGLPGKGYTSLRGGLEWAALHPGNRFQMKAIIQDQDPDKEYVYELTINIVSGDSQETLARVTIVAERLTAITYVPDTNRVVTSDVLIGGSIPELTSEPETFTALYWKRFLRTKSEQLADALACVSRTFETIFILDPTPSRMRSYTPLSRDLLPDASNIAGVLAKLPDEWKRDVENQLATYASRLPEGDIVRVWAEPVGRRGSDAMLYCEEQWHPEHEPLLVDARNMSDGTLRFLAILTALLTYPEHSLVAIEDVDNGLHPSRARMLLDMLREIGQQRHIDVLVTTHSPALLDAMERDMLPFVTVAHRNPHTGESTLTLLENIDNLPKLLASGSPGQLIEQGAIERGARASLQRGAE